MEVILLPFDSTESDGKLQLWKLGAHLSITRINSELHEFMKLFQNIKKIKKKIQNVCTKYQHLNKNIYIDLQLWISLHATVRQNLIKL